MGLPLMEVRAAGSRQWPYPSSTIWPNARWLAMAVVWYRAVAELLHRRLGSTTKHFTMPFPAELASSPTAFTAELAGSTATNTKFLSDGVGTSDGVISAAFSVQPSRPKVIGSAPSHARREEYATSRHSPRHG